MWYFSTRYLPSGDLEEIYYEYYGEKKITKEEIEVCSAIMLLGWIGEKIAGAKLFPKYSKTSPFLMENFHTYFQGKGWYLAACECRYIFIKLCLLSPRNTSVFRGQVSKKD